MRLWLYLMENFPLQFSTPPSTVARYIRIQGAIWILCKFSCAQFNFELHGISVDHAFSLRSAADIWLACLHQCLSRVLPGNISIFVTFSSAGWWKSKYDRLDTAKPDAFCIKIAGAWEDKNRFRLMMPHVDLISYTNLIQAYTKSWISDGWAAQQYWEKCAISMLQRPTQYRKPSSALKC